ncbi:hypothetical protein N7532_009280 [Penicillium argentinense]|uniref:Uncharacterized protein n=1 Tax=Penicillium argentinense TaxID=1131581 RepID=A0A9W9EZ65_9EURO|nr:uncharacterized protein N7532_009280 [Penicillium argentinense]KAJ5090596.1 hypothetical protein N7532_009280 [Penicillium argentinense]
MDEAQIRVGRTSQILAFQKENIVLDILALSKALGCCLPLPCVSTCVKIEHGCKEAGLMWLTTDSNTRSQLMLATKCCRLRDYICKHASERGGQLRSRFIKLQQKYWFIGDIRGRGLLQGIEFISNPKAKSFDSDLGQAVSECAMTCGISCNIVSLSGMGGVFRLAPPVIVTAEEIEEGLKILDKTSSFV